MSDNTLTLNGFSEIASHRVSADGEVQGTPRHKAYVTACPVKLTEKLEAAGYSVERSDSHGAGWKVALTVRSLADRPEAVSYGAEVSILLNHKGTGSILFRRGAVRFACNNSFHPGDLIHRIRHCSKAARDFVDNPGSTIAHLMDLTVADVQRMVQRVEALRGRQGGQSLLNLLFADKPKVLKATATIARAKYADTLPGVEMSLWSAVQALTDATGSFAASRTEAAERVLEGDVLQGLLQATA